MSSTARSNACSDRDRHQSFRQPRAVDDRDAARARRRRHRVHEVLRAAAIWSMSVARRIPTSTRSLRCSPPSSCSTVRRTGSRTTTNWYVEVCRSWSVMFAASTTHCRSSTICVTGLDLDPTALGSTERCRPLPSVSVAPRSSRSGGVLGCRSTVPPTAAPCSARIGVDLVTAESEVAYPVVELDEIASPDLVLVPSEPYDFTEAHLDELRVAFPGRGSFASTARTCSGGGSGPRQRSSPASGLTLDVPGAVGGDDVPALGE